MIESRGYYLGKHSGNKVYLAKPRWDCGWYWGFGYVQGYKRIGTMVSHEHFDSLFLKNNIFDSFKEYFSEECVLSDEQIWKLIELMKRFYILRQAADLFYRGSANVSSRNLPSVKNEDLANQINNDIMLDLFEEIEKIFKE